MKKRTTETVENGKSARHSTPLRKRGSALAAVAIICTAIAYVAGSAMNLSTTGRRLNKMAELNMEARNAAEAIVEFGMADLVNRFDTSNSFDSNDLAPTKKPLKLPPAFFSMFAGSHLLLPDSTLNGTQPYGTYDTELIGGTVTDAGWTFVDSKVPGNEDDTLANRNVLVRQIRVYGKAYVRDSRGKVIIARCRKSLQVRDAPLFSYGVFYNMDLEFVVGPTMTMSGPVHTNADLYLECDNSLSFKDTVSAVGNIYHQLKDGYNETLGSGTISFVNDDGTSIPMKYDGVWYDSTASNWYDVSMELWDGNVQDAAYGVSPCASVAMPSYVEDDPDTTADETLNYAYKLIMPLDQTSDADPSVEEQKYEYKAGLVVVVDTDSDGIASYSLYAQHFNADGSLQYSGTSADRTLLCSSTTTDPEVLANLSSIFTINNYETTTTTTTTGTGRHQKTVTTTTTTGGMYDARRQMALDMMDVDMGALRDALEANDATYWGDTSSTTDSTYQPDDWWNGVVYFEFPQDSSDTVGTDGVQHSVDGYGLRLYDAEATLTGSNYTPGIPDPSWSSATGTTVATNNVMYIQGSYNADGSSSTGSAAEVDCDEEPTAGLAADAITFLSPGWDDEESADIATNSSSSSRYAGSSSDYMEVSAAVITGVVPTNKGGNGYGSGAVNNVLRFLDIWNQTVRYRGSLVALYESEVADQVFRVRFDSTNYVYNPPTRDWGFNTLFKSGVYPPGTPNMRTYKSVDFVFLNADEWATEIAALQ